MIRTTLAIATLLASTALSHATDTLIINASEDAYNGDASMTVTVDGAAQPFARTVTAIHGSGQTEAFLIPGTWGAGQHKVVIGFANDAYGGSASQDRNLYVDSISYDGAIVAGGTYLSAGTQTFTVGTAPPKPPAHDVLIGGFAGVTALTAANTAGLAATGRGGFYLHNSAVGANTTSNAAVRSVLSAEVAALGGPFEDEAGENGFFDAGNLWDSYVKQAGINPDAIILNCGSSSDIAAGTGLAAIKTWMDAARARFPAVTVAPVVTPGGNDANLGADYGTAAHWANQRALELYGKRAVDDVPAANWNQTAWSNYVLGHAKWVLAQGLPYDLILSPSAGTTFLADVKTVMAAFKAAGVNPTRVIVESYTPGVGATVGPESDPTTLNAAALWIAQNKPSL